MARLPSLALGLLFVVPSGAYAGNTDTQVDYTSPVGCHAVTAQEITAVTLDWARQMGTFCESQNEELARAGHPRCPPTSCYAEIRPGDNLPPTLQVTVNYGNTTSSLGSVSFPGKPVGGARPSSSSASGSTTELASSGSTTELASSSSTTGRLPGETLSITASIILPLGRNPDTLVCVNPLSPQVQTLLYQRLLEATKAPPPASCAGQTP